jgi:soluble lytic murein transglycosylase-like protein
MKDLIKVTVFWFAFLILCFAGFAKATEDPRAEEILAYQKWFFAKAPNQGKRAALLVNAVIEASDEYGLDPLLVAVIISRESSWDEKAIGSRGEVGLMQVHGVAAQGQDLKTARGQIKAGARWLRLSLDKCKTLEGALSAYGTGECTLKNFALSRVHYYKYVLKRFRKEGN